MTNYGKGKFVWFRTIMALVKKRKESLWDIAAKQNAETAVDGLGERTLILAGSKGVGKSTMIQRFLERNETVKETLAMEYTFGRKSGRSLIKDVCHVWELGGGTLFSHLLPVHIDADKKDATLILVLDLSSPETLWHVTETILQQVYGRFKKAEKSVSVQQETRFRDHKDSRYIIPFPIPLCIVGGKYDLFENLDPENRKIICRSLRQVAHSLGASLIFYSDKDGILVKRLKDVFNHYGFGGSLWKTISNEYNKPISIPWGSDSFEQIGVNPIAPHQHGLSLDRFKHTYTTHFPQNLEAESTNVPDDPAKDPNFKEPIIDLLRAEKDEELDRFLRETESRKKLVAKAEA